MHVVYFFLSVRTLIMSEVEGRVPKKYHWNFFEESEKNTNANYVETLIFYAMRFR